MSILQEPERTPTGGNAHNQLAVLATYAEAELPAVVHYFRSLAAPQPFPVARQNLVMLFEQNRARFEQLGAAAAGRDRDAARDARDRARLPLVKLLLEMSTRFVRIHGAPLGCPNVVTHGEKLFPEMQVVASRGACIVRSWPRSNASHPTTQW